MQLRRNIFYLLLYFVLLGWLKIVFLPKLTNITLFIQNSLGRVQSYALIHKPAFKESLQKNPIKEILGSGVALTDFDKDNLLDIYITLPTRLFKNTGSGTFREVTKKTRLDKRKNLKYLQGSSYTGIFFDYNNDGCEDLFRGQSLYRNNCNGTFDDVSETAGVQRDDCIFMGAGAADYNSDGYLDLYDACYGLGPRNVYNFEPNILYRNNRNSTFTDVTKTARVTGETNCRTLYWSGIDGSLRTKKIRKQAYQPVWMDYNNDQKIDLIVATDNGISPLYRNNGDGTFTETTKEAGLCKLGSGMGIAVGDFNTDGYIDIYQTNSGANFLWKNNGDGTFTDVAAESGTADHLSIGWGAEFFDYDNDGDLDLYVVNGTIPVTEIAKGNEVGVSHYDKLFQNQDNGTFKDRAFQEGITSNDTKQAAAFGDLNNDGFIDVFVGAWSLMGMKNNLNKVPENHLYINHPNGNNWITLRLIGTKSNRDAIGAKVEIQTNSKKQIRQVIAGSSFASQSDLRVHFGIGRATHIDEIKILWPSGKTTTLKKIKPNQILEIEER